MAAGHATITDMDLTTVEVRPADLSRPDDAEALLTLLDEYAREEFGQSRPLDLAVRERLIEDLRGMPHSRVFLAYSGGAAVGLANCFLGYSTFRAAPLLNVHDLTVARSARGRGVGRRLLSAVEEHARRCGCVKVTLEVRADNTVAIGLYSRLGYGPAPGADEAQWFLSKPLTEAPEHRASSV